MFTGIIEATGRVTRSEPRGGDLCLGIVAPDFDASDVALGDSIAVSGCCLTVVAREGPTLAFDVSAETLSCTTGLDRQGPVNLEKALRAGDRLGGHLMTGHVDGVGTVRAFAPVHGAADGSVTLTVEAPAALARFIAAKGSVAVAGVSLTVNTVEGARFSVNLIPHTLAVTTLAQLATGARVNLEVDLVARYVARLRESEEESWY